MEIGKLYDLKRFYWFLYQKMEDSHDLWMSCEISSFEAKRICQDFYTYNTQVSFLDPDSLVLCIEKGKFTRTTEFYCMSRKPTGSSCGMNAIQFKIF